MFLARKDELSKLNKRYEKGAFECIVIYGACVKIGLNQEKPYK